MQRRLLFEDEHKGICAQLPRDPAGFQAHSGSGSMLEAIESFGLDCFRHYHSASEMDIIATEPSGFIDALYSELP